MVSRYLYAQHTQHKNHAVLTKFPYAKDINVGRYLCISCGSKRVKVDRSFSKKYKWKHMIPRCRIGCTL